LFGLTSKEFAEQTSKIIAVTLITGKANLVIYTGKRQGIIKYVDLATYSGEAGQRGKKLPKELQKVEAMAAVTA
jgi:hypothetical protein